MSEKGFDAEKYLQAQQDEFNKALTRDPKKPVFIEFGGKPFSDHHAERVLPGYDAECKAEILRETMKLAEVVMVVNALDILKPPDGRTLKGRMRGDTNLFYDRETLRLIEDAHKRQLPIEKVVLSVTPRQMNPENLKIIDKFKFDLGGLGVKLFTHYKIQDYPNKKIFDDKNIFAENEPIRSSSGNLIAVSPGGGSGKFGVLLSEMFHALTNGEIPDYVKFETFPIYQLDASHALNLAFEAATADLGNKVINIDDKDGKKRTSYDKDLENFALLQKMFETFGHSTQLSHMQDAVDMGINQIISGITDVDIVNHACLEEIARRILRYEAEVKSGIEQLSTLQNAYEVLGRYNSIYQINTPLDKIDENQKNSLS